MKIKKWINKKWKNYLLRRAENREYIRTQTLWYKQGNEINTNILNHFNSSIENVLTQLNLLDKTMQLHLSHSTDRINYDNKKVEEINKRINALHEEVEILKEKVKYICEKKKR